MNFILANTGSLMESLLFSPRTIWNMQGTAVQMAGIATALLGFFTLISFCAMAFKNLTEKQKVAVDSKWMGDIIIKLVLMWAYVPVFAFVLLFAQYLSSKTAPDYEKMANISLAYNMSSNPNSDYDVSFDLEKGAVFSDKQPENPDDKIEADAKNGFIDSAVKKTPTENLDEYVEDQASNFSIWDILRFDFLKMFMRLSFSSFALILTSVIQIIVMVIISQLGYILYLAGPFAIAFSILPWFQDKFQTWFSTFAGVIFTTTTMNLLNWAQVSSVGEALSEGISTGNGAESMFESGILVMTAVNISNIILNCLVFWLTSRWVGSSEGGKVLTTAMQSAKIAASALMGPALATKMGMGKGAVGSIASESKKGFEQ